MQSTVSRPCLVLIASPEHLPALRQFAPAAPTELLTFTDTEPLLALEAITTRRPQVIALEKTFAGTPRGAALIGRIKADPALAHTEILVLAHDDRQALDAFRQLGAAPSSSPLSGAAASPSPPLDFPDHGRRPQRQPGGPVDQRRTGRVECGAPAESSRSRRDGG
jgi:hypothetical protein